MKDTITRYLDSLVLTPMIRYTVTENSVDQIYCVTYYKDHVPITSILVSSWDKEDEWKFKVRDAYMECIALVTGDTQILRDRYLEDPGEWDDFD